MKYSNNDMCAIKSGIEPIRSRFIEEHVFIVESCYNRNCTKFQRTSRSDMIQHGILELYDVLNKCDATYKTFKSYARICISMSMIRFDLRNTDVPIKANSVTIKNEGLFNVANFCDIDDIEHAIPSSEDFLDIVIKKQLLERSLKTLTETERAIFGLRYRSKLSTLDISSKLNISRRRVSKVIEKSGNKIINHIAPMWNT